MTDYARGKKGAVLMKNEKQEERIKRGILDVFNKQSAIPGGDTSDYILAYRENMKRGGTIQNINTKGRS